MSREVWLRAALVVSAVACSACMTNTGHPGAPSFDAEYHIAPPDTLTIIVRPEPEIRRDVVVRPDGRVSLDLIGDVDVRGRTISDVRAEIARRLKEFIVQPDVTVTLTKSESRTFYIFGEVMRPGAYPLIGDVTALYALGMAGGSTKFADENSARLVRPSPEAKLVYPVYYKSIVREGEGETNYMLQPGDVIYVPPTITGTIGYAIQTIFFPIQAFMGLGGSQAITVMTGGAL
ncbi:MAG TPA: polysaccharide biosynthesis/export family protein [Myxococcota bacterium]|nr:polysaccharide biosynthesis/export family protein [Myxococcota bacterium]